MKKCPYCAEEIQDEALKCRFCGQTLKKKKGWWACLLGCLIGMVAIFILTFLFLFLGFLLLKFIVIKLFYRVPPLPYNYFRSVPQGLEQFFRDFSEFLRNFWDKLMQMFGSSGTTL